MPEKIAGSPAEFREAIDALKDPTDVHHRTTMRAALLVSPIGFRVSESSATDNLYMMAGREIDAERALAQHEAVTAKLLSLGVPVITFPGLPGLDDAVYPNNAFATTAGRLIIGHMRHEVRQRETRRRDLREFIAERLGYEVVDLSERDGLAELTGSLIIDHARRVGYCGLSSRTDAAGCAAMHEAFELALTYRFRLVPSEYHTNIVLSVLAGRACVLHAGSFADPEVPESIASVYEGRTVRISDEEKAAFVGNCLAVTDSDVVMSETARSALRPESREVLERSGFAVHGVAIDELEKGGGSLRCLIAEIF